MDSTDIALVAALRLNARLTISELAAELGVARATARTRLDRLVETGEIAGFTVVLKGDLEIRQIHAITLIEVTGTEQDRVVGRLRAMAEVLAVHTTNGRWDLVAEIGAEDLGRFDDTLRRIRQIPGIAATETNILLSTAKRVGSMLKGP